MFNFSQKYKISFSWALLSVDRFSRQNLKGKEIDEKESRRKFRVSVQGVKSLGGHFACLWREFDFYEIKKILLFFKEKREILLHF